MQACGRKTQRLAHFYLFFFQEVTPAALKEVATGVDENIEACQDEGGMLEVSKKGISKSTVSNCCAICLEAYEPEEMIVWSCNDECPHIYHRECMADYLVSFKGEGSPCPYCRQMFCSLVPQSQSDE
jgi:hypothetical protein